jgi:peroxiredoxin Q/BCP
MPLIDPGKKAPAFTLRDQHGTAHKLSDYAGRHVVLYFHPPDDTPGCTRESCDFQAALPRYTRAGAAVLGVSILDEASKARFADKHGLTFPLLADVDHEVAEKYGVWQQNSR